MKKMLLIVGSGRSGTKAFAAAFGGFHEYNISSGPRFAKYFEEKNPQRYLFDTIEKRKQYLAELFQGAENHDPFIDSDNTLVHLIDAIHECYPFAKFIFTLRDGRDFVTSAANRNWHAYDVLDHIPLPGDPYYDLWPTMTVLQKNTWIWTSRNKRALEHLNKVPKSQYLRVQIERCRDKETLDQIESFAGIPFADRRFLQVGNFHSNMHSQHFPYKDKWTPKMHDQFNQIAGELMQTLGYSIVA